MVHTCGGFVVGDYTEFLFTASPTSLSWLSRTKNLCFKRENQSWEYKELLENAETFVTWTSYLLVAFQNMKKKVSNKKGYSTLPFNRYTPHSPLTLLTIRTFTSSLLRGRRQNFVFFFIFHPIFLKFAHNMWNWMKKQLLL